MSQPPAGSPPDLGPVATAILDASDTMVVLTDRQGTIQYVNPAFTAVTGYAAQEAVGGTPRLLRSGAQDDTFYAKLWATVLGGSAWHGELINRRKDGSLYTDEMTIVPLKGPDGVPNHFVAIKRDVSTRVQSLTAASPVGIAHADRDGRLLYVNRRTEELLGDRFEGLIGMGWLSRFADADRQAVLDDIAAAYGGRPEGAAVERRLQLPSGRWVHIRAAPLMAGGDEPLGIVLSLEDVTAETEANSAVIERERFARDILDSLSDATAVIDAPRTIVATNAPWHTFISELGADPDRHGIGAKYQTVCAGLAARSGNARVLHEGIEDVLQGRLDSFEHEYQCGAAGNRRWYHARVTPLRTFGGAVIAHTDVTWRKDAEGKLAFAARYDALTGLLNRAAGHDRLKTELQGARLESEGIGVLFIDLDGFKSVNDTLGHAAGDTVLVAAAARITRQVRPSDVVARMGGDEFLVILPDADDHDLRSVAKRIRNAVGAPFSIDAGVARIGASIGSAKARVGDSLDALIARADAAMYREKQSRPAAGTVDPH